MTGEVSNSCMLRTIFAQKKKLLRSGIEGSISKYDDFDPPSTPFVVPGDSSLVQYVFDEKGYLALWRLLPILDGNQICVSKFED